MLFGYLKKSESTLTVAIGEVGLDNGGLRLERPPQENMMKAKKKPGSDINTRLPDVS